MKSVRGHLLFHLMVALLMGSIIVGIVSYLSASDEINELYDEHLRQIALVLENQKDVLAKSEISNSVKTHLKGEEEFLIQIWNDHGELVYSSHPLIQFPMADKQGFKTEIFDAADWRSYATSPHNLTLQVAQPLSARDELILEIALKMLIPIMLQFPIMGLFIWLAVGSSLESLSVISTDLQKRSVSSLQPLDLRGVPREIAPLVNALNGLLVKLDHSMKMQRQFTADAAHELRTPLTAVRLQLDLLERTQSPEERVEAMNSLMSGVQRSIGLVEQLLAFARIEAEIDATSHEDVDVSAIVREAVRHFSNSAVQKNIDLGIVRQEPSVVSANTEGIRTILNNLLENAIRYTPDGGRVDVALYMDQGNTVIDVSDNGIGIAEEERARIFDRFYRVPGSKTQGTGLGLAIVKNITEKHGASIILGKGIDDSGISFKIIFPPHSS